MKLNDMFKTLKKTTGAVEITKSPFAKVNEFLSTNSMALNRICSGSVFNGIPQGRITCLFGENSTGKSLIAYLTAITALKEGKIDRVFVVDSEGGVLNKTFEDSGVDMSKITYMPVKSVEDCSVKMTQMYDMFDTCHREYLEDPDNNDDIRALVILDSFGALVSEKQLKDALEKDKMVADQGISAKMRNALIRGLMMRVVTSNVGLICINHSYSGPEMFPSKIKNMAGGEGIKYSAHLIVQCEKLLIKAADDNFLTGRETGDESRGFYKGNKLKFFVIKNRVVVPGFSTTLYIDFKSGLSKYDGLIEDAVKFGFLEEVRGGYVCKSYSDKKITYKELMAKDEIWDTFIQDFDKKSKESMEYSNATSREIDKINEELDANEDDID